MQAILAFAGVAGGPKEGGGGGLLTAGTEGRTSCGGERVESGVQWHESTVAK